MRSLFSSFLVAIISFPFIILLVLIFYTIILHNRLLRLSLSLGLEIRIVISGVCILVCSLCVCSRRVAATRSAYDFWVSSDKGGVRMLALRD